MNVTRFFSLLLVSLIAWLGLVSCQSGNLSVGQQTVTPRELNVQIIDSITVQTATVLADSFFTYADNNVLVGQWTDSYTGRTQAKGFTSIGYTSNSLSTQTGLVYDSLVLVLPIAFAYGDTTSLFTLNVHRLTSTLKNRPYSNLSSIGYEPTPYLTKVVRSAPFSANRQYRLRLPDAVQKDFVTRITNRTIENQDELDLYLKGFALVSTSGKNTMIGLNTLASAGAGWILYYHTTDLSPVNNALVFPLSTQDPQVQTSHFSQVLTDRTGTPLQSLKTRTDVVSSTATNNQAIVIPTAQLTTRLTIPTFDRYALGGGQFRGVNRAELILEPIRSRTNDNVFPFTTLQLYQTNASNQLTDINGRPLDVLATTTSGTASAQLTNYRPYDLIAQPEYRFDMTYYVNQVIAGRLSNKPMLLTVSPVGQQLTLQSLVQRLTFGDALNASYRLRLQLYLTTEK